MGSSDTNAQDVLKSPRVGLRRYPEKGAYDFDTVARILDRTFLCHVGFVVGGQPYVIPTNFGRDGRRLLIHGSAASRMLLNLADGIPVCVTVTLMDGLVLARSIFNHSINHESVVVLGRARVVDGGEKLEALRLLSEHILPGRWDDVRPPNDTELKSTLILSLEIEEASAKIRAGAPYDAPEDLDLPYWAGEVPYTVAAGAPVREPRLAAGIATPAYLAPGLLKPKNLP
jgi:uncharacterized protein